MRFTAYGHGKISAVHMTTLEFTKDRAVTEQGDCIVGVNSDFDEDELKKMEGKLRVVIKAGDLTEELTCLKNSHFDDKDEMVIRRGDFPSRRTLGIRSDKACIDLSDEFREKLKDPNQRIDVEITGI